MNQPPKIKPPVRSATSCWNQRAYQPAYNLHPCQGPSSVGPYTHFDHATWGFDEFMTGSGGNTHHSLGWW